MRPRPDPDDQPQPEPLEQGRLGPPRRKPPTAVGTATPRGPRHPHRPSRYATGLTRTRRVAIGLLSSLLVASGGAILVLTSPGASMVWGFGAVGVGLTLVYQVITLRTPYDGLAEYLRRRRRSTGQQTGASKPPST